MVSTMHHNGKVYILVRQGKANNRTCIGCEGQKETDMCAKAHDCYVPDEDKLTGVWKEITK